MSNEEAVLADTERLPPTPRPMTITWRYLGDRTAADLAYCVRFGLLEAPEPTESLNGILSYPLPKNFIRK